MVYFIQSEDGPIKIGTSAQPKARLKQFQAGCPFRLTLVGVESGGTRKEKQLHGWFDDLRIRRDGEWFWPGDALLEYLRSLMDPLWPEQRRQPAEWTKEYDAEH